MDAIADNAAHVLHSYPRSFPRCVALSVTVNGCAVDVCQSRVGPFVTFTCAAQVTLEIARRHPFKNAVVRPLRSAIAATVEDGIVRVVMPGPANVCIEFDDGDRLFVFASAPESAPPASDDPQVHYFRGGQVYEVPELTLKDGETLYLEAGAVFKGSIRATAARNVRVRGRGVIDGSYFVRGVDGRHSIRFEDCEGVCIEDVTIVNPSGWMLVLSACRDAQVRNVRELACGLGSDGIDLVSCRDVVVEDCFLHNGDDCIAIKAFNTADRGASADVENILVQRCALMNQEGGNALEIGFELRARAVRNIVFRDCDVICVHHHGAVFSIHNGEFATVENVRYEDIRVEHYYDLLIDLRIVWSRWSRFPERGRIRNVQFKNIYVQQAKDNWGYSKSLIGGYDPQHMIEHVVIEEFYLDNQKVTTADALDLYIKNARDVVIK